MKVKTVNIYLGIFVIVVLLLLITTNDTNNIPQENTDAEVLPNDDIHKGFQEGEAPGKGNVSGSFKHQMEMLKKAVEENPDDTAHVKKYAELLASAHNPQKAVELYKSILVKNPNRIDILLGITFAYYNMRDMNKAEEYTQKVLNIDRNNHEANYNMGAIAAGRGNTAKAKEIWEDVIERFPNTTVAHIAENSINSLNK